MTFTNLNNFKTMMNTMLMMFMMPMAMSNIVLKKNKLENVEMFP